MFSASTKPVAPAHLAYSEKKHWWYFTRCRVNNLYEFSPEAAAVDPESHKAGTEGGAVAGATEAAEGAGNAGAEAMGRR